MRVGLIPDSHSPMAMSLINDRVENRNNTDPEVVKKQLQLAEHVKKGQ